MPSDQPSRPKPIQSGDLPWENWADIPRFTSRYKHLTRAACGDHYHVGMAIEELPPGSRSAPFHYHIFEEEHLFILDGTPTLRLGATRYRLKPDDYVCFPAGQKAGHCLVNESDALCRYIVIGERNPNEICLYPDSNKVLVRALDRTVLDLSARRGYWHGEETGLPADQAQLPSLAPIFETAEKPYPPINAADLSWETTQIDAHFGGQAKHLTYSAVGRDYRVGVMIEAPGPGQRLAPRHYHMVEEEQALILEGDVRLLLGDESHDLKPGDYVCFPAGLDIGHSFMNIGKGPCRYLMVGERSPHDVCVYPDSNKMALSVIPGDNSVFDMSARRRYWDGEANI